MNINLHAEKNQQTNVAKNYQVTVLENLESITVDGDEINLIQLQHQLNTHQTIRFDCGESYLLLSRERILLHTPTLHLKSANGASQTINHNNPKLKQYRLNYQWQVIGDPNHKQTNELGSPTVSVYIHKLTFPHHCNIAAEQTTLTMTDDQLLTSAANLHVFYPEALHG